MTDSISELFWSASVEELKRGYVHQHATDSYICLICGRSFMKGVIYREEDTYYEAEKFASVHLRKEHTSMLDYLLQLNKKLTGLTDLQKSLLELFHRGLSDSEIVKALGGGSTSTIRHHRFTLREKEKQAKLFLAVMELAQPKSASPESFITVHRGATVLDERYAITEKENAELLKQYFPQGLDGALAGFPKKEKRKIAILRHIAGKFAADKAYTEKEVNDVLKSIYPNDHVTLRRYLIEYGFMNRLDDGSKYWMNL